MSVRALVSQNNSANKTKLQQGVAGCYYCLSCFPVEHIKNWVNDREGMTACCPYCTVDTVLPEQTLQDMAQLLFNDGSLTLPTVYKCLEECRRIYF